ncbi:MAG: single-stranded-DNA-specific exonuclease RecJ [Planctomycetota bacterium]
MTHRWSVRTDAGGDEAEMRLAARLRIEPVVARVLLARRRGDEAESWLTPSLRAGLHDPSHLPDLDRAAARLLDAARSGHPIAIYGDYDVDGVTASAILWHVLRAVVPHALLMTYIPHRLDEGYGVHAGAVRTLAEQGARVIVSVDCGVTAFEPAAAARECGVDLIITDHHNLPPRESGLPDAYAVVHPRLEGSEYPFGELCGAGVAFKLAWRIATMAAGSERVHEPMRETLLDLLALAALGTVADIVPLVDENRVIARFGLARVRTTRIAGLGALVRASGLAGESVDAEAAGFKLAPRLNACGRLGHAREALELLTTAEGDRAGEIARVLTSVNAERQSIERRIFEEACEAAESAGQTEPSARAIVLADERWHPGVVGIVCSRLVRRYHRPSILLHRDNGTCAGSGRSIDGYSLHAGLAASAAHLTRFGGHDMAAGLALETAHLDAFSATFGAHAAEHIDDSMLVRRLDVDAPATLSELSAESVHRLRTLGPFGRENPPPRLVVRDLRIADAPRLMGERGRHLALRASAGGASAIRLIGWGWGDRAEHLAAGQRIDAVIEPKLNTWNGVTSVEGELVDARVASR